MEGSDSRQNDRDIMEHASHHSPQMHSNQPGATRRIWKQNKVGLEQISPHVGWDDMISVPGQKRPGEPHGTNKLRRIGAMATDSGPNAG